jgi:cobyric acid synthase CobQ
VRIDRSGLSATALSQQLLAQGIAIRLCNNFDGLDDRFFRIAVRTEAENQRLCELLCPRPNFRPKKKRPAIMFQGTSSNAGKSIMTTALCRILLQDGFRIAPFKAQNMSLNSFVTREGGEMGRAQVVQAQACHVEPETRMNPILLKPNSDTGAQVIVNGKPVGNMNVEEYMRFKPEAFLAAQQAFDSLADEYDAVVLEGAGSPAEVNLKSHDIVNMDMARYAAAPVLLVGDIDRGGVFASFVGTMEVLEEWERNQIAGFLVNRFRGSEALLQDALNYTLRHTGKPVFGVIPYLSKLRLPEEDSVTFKSMASSEGSSRIEGIDIALIDLPHISNFTDFDALRNEPDVTVRIVRAPEDIGNPDAIILPGSKNVLDDLACLRRQGLDRVIIEQSSKTEVIGICGGYQMLGGRIEDAPAIESSRKAMQGLGLLELSTAMAEEKTLVRVSGRHSSGLPLQGYEIHHGRSDASALQPIVIRSDGEVIGAGRGNIWGTYMHGVFDADEFRRAFIDKLRERRGLKPLGRICAPYDLEPALDRLAETVRKSIRVDSLYRLMGLR